MDAATGERRVPGDGLSLTRRTRITLVAAVVAVGAAIMLWRAPVAHPVRATTEPAAWPPLPRRVTVEVLNAGGISGAARAGELQLRHAGLDVVSWANDTGHALARTEVLVRRGDTTGVGRVTSALGYPPLLLDSADATRLVDLTVKLGRDFAVPPEGVKPIR